MKEQEKIIQEIKRYLQGKVKFAFVYGSILSKYFREDSDLDVAVYLGKPAKLDTMIDLKYDLEKHFDYKHEFDVVILDSADPIIAMQVLANGHLIINNDPSAFVLYKARMISQYLDFKMDRKIIEDRIGEGSVYA